MSVATFFDERLRLIALGRALFEANTVQSASFCIGETEDQRPCLRVAMSLFLAGLDFDILLFKSPGGDEVHIGLMLRSLVPLN